jgi:hypothetical protein
MVTAAATQHCPRCAQDLTIEHYHADKWGKPGHYCRPCMTAYKREWRLARGVKPQRRFREPKPPRALSTTYGAVHVRLRKTRGAAAAHPCQHCGGEATDWAYDRTDPKPLTGLTAQGRPVEYSAELSRYIPLCRPCHSRFDMKPATPARAPATAPVTMRTWTRSVADPAGVAMTRW